MTDYSHLLDSGRLARVKRSSASARRLLVIAERDLGAAQALVGQSPDWVLSISYNAMLQAGRALLADRGFRTQGEGHHVTVIRFLEVALGVDRADDIALLDALRRQRHRSVYGVAGTVSESRSQAALKTAVSSVAEVSGLVGG